MKCIKCGKKRQFEMFPECSKCIAKEYIEMEGKEEDE